ncbi:MAG: MarC family protein [Bacteroidota bacterium]|nr:MarC family protein [Bacteroidota bacterium]
MDFTTTIEIAAATIVTLFPVTNPVGTGIALNPYMVKLNRHDNRQVAFRISMYTFFLLMTVMLIGKYILMVFGLSVSVVQLAGGILVIRAGWNLLNAPDENDDSKDKAGYSLENLENKIFYPLTFPITTGAGVIAAVLGLAAKYSSDSFSTQIWVIIGITVGLIINSLSIYFVYANTSRVTNKLKHSGKIMADKLSAFLVFCVGLEITVNAVFKIVASMKS